MQQFLRNLPCALFMLLCINHAFHSVDTYGRRWVWGQYGPHSLTRPDGRTYADGSKVDDMTSWIIRSGQEETIIVMIWLADAFMFLLLVHTVRKTNALRKRWEAMREENDQRESTMFCR